MTPRDAVRAVALLTILAGPFGLVLAQQKEEPKESETERPLNPYGHMAGMLTDQPARFYVWYEDQEGWHLRSAATKRGLIKFEGTVRVINGELRRCRPIGLDSKGKYADQWSLDKERRELKFMFWTAQVFDGFDFNVAPRTAELEFELKVGGREQPKRIFIGGKGQHPPKVRFTLPAAPEPPAKEETTEAAAKGGA